MKCEQCGNGLSPREIWHLTRQSFFKTEDKKFCSRECAGKYITETSQ